MYLKILWESYKKYVISSLHIGFLLIVNYYTIFCNFAQYKYA